MARAMLRTSTLFASLGPVRACAAISQQVSRARYASGSTPGSSTHTHQTFPFPTHLKNPTPFDIFHLPHSASRQDIKSRYYDLVRFHHPDCAACRSLPRPIAHAQFQAITNAYEILTGKRKLLRGASTTSEAAELARRRASYRAAYASGRPYTGGRNEWGGFEYPDGGGHRVRHNRGDLMGSQTFYVAIAVMTLVLVSLHATHISPLLASKPASSVSVVDRRHKEAQLALEEARLRGQEYGEERREEVRRWVKEAGLEGIGQRIGHSSRRKEVEEDL
ncbi:hypothetical protein FRC12_008152 [Ceratobasidium sp. 428]|nr:hypothetical protein FRC12_008152 [Ceratobasidium sp. 428]